MPPKKGGGKKNKNDEWQVFNHVCRSMLVYFPVLNTDLLTSRYQGASGRKQECKRRDDEAAERKLASLMAKKEEEEVDWDDESDDEPALPVKPAAGKKAAFAMLMDDDDDDDDAKSDSDTERVEKVEEKKPEKQEKKPEKKVEAPAQTKQDKKKGKKGKKGKQEEDDDLDAILADLELNDKAPAAGKGKRRAVRRMNQSLQLLLKIVRRQHLPPQIPLQLRLPQEPKEQAGGDADEGEGEEDDASKD
ncbi:hypothetical protein ANCCAN_18069, partial [Ancylostoma caninum]